eukprot:11544712-Alexandrium_andersonii.AAC.1
MATAQMPLSITVREHGARNLDSPSTQNGAGDQDLRPREFAQSRCTCPFEAKTVSPVCFYHSARATCAKSGGTK